MDDTISAMAKLRNAMLPLDLDQKLQAELRAGERVIYVTQPLPRLARRAAIPIMLFGIPFGGFALFWICMAYWMMSKSHSMPEGPWVAFPLFGIPFLLIGLGMITSPYWAGRKARRTIYAITDQRALIFKGGFFGSTTVTTFMPDRLTSIERKERRDGSGDVVFEQFTERRGSGSRTVRRGFIGVDNVREVEALILDTLVKPNRMSGASNAAETIR